MAERNFYEILHVNRNAAFKEIERAYEYLKSHYKSVLTFHHNKTDDKEWKRVKAAYKVLSNKDKRAQYDRTLPRQIIQEEIPRKSEPKNYYEILRVGRDTTLEEIEAAYQRRLNQCKFLLDSKVLTNEIYQQSCEVLKAICAVLSDKDKRAEYDKTLPEPNPAQIPKKFIKIKRDNSPRLTTSKNYYAVLDVGYNATDDEIKRAYRKLAKKYHPDFNLNDKFAEEKMLELNAAYAVLKDKDKRAEYDKFIIRR